MSFFPAACYVAGARIGLQEILLTEFLPFTWECFSRGYTVPP